MTSKPVGKRVGEAVGKTAAEKAAPPLLQAKRHDAASVFTAAGLIRGARRQKGLPDANVPRVCLLDPDGDIVRQLRAAGRLEPDRTWACYHTELYRLKLGDGGLEVGIVGCAVGAPFAVLVAEQLFACGCGVLISITSAGQLEPVGAPAPYFILIDRALRDEGTSFHYMPSDRFSHAAPKVLQALDGALTSLRVPVFTGPTWTTDAPFRETADAIAERKAEGLLAVEMEAAALYAFAASTSNTVVCFAFVTNQMAQISGDFEKGEADGAVDALCLVRAVVARLVD